MKKTMLIITLSLLTQVAFALGGSSSSGLGNPAWIFCSEIGGEPSIIETPEGQAGMCTIEEWTLFELTFDHNFLTTSNQKLANPASVYCQKIGGELFIVTEPAGQKGMCTIEQWTLWDIFNK
ncbi:MAG: hypothetical protein A2381_17225 [Bdellovibrionales bacterium RIFOXYB1_FULL_37_110]|nr:MAG: hypothetical protein A2181_08230 [Bdellovibrionales bacterium RIFOXYA1_FULL_38_20]OFZ50137.1 MAG: hypothetical protein A2417_19060 [Bdellovibrionales bacterium RIFOXYC1_FULL_37_79]OFZ60043.1 MAG: hypothetical protein A2381_17225 [Bdellovibrionales bacterium RIFOXYB1_FULL_37_110]OFZ62667.1 MAG: hypothetical protein A2577_16220 [Bdellovibrionales bacterium RIFOXYD1_FULL_36_51]